MSVQKNIENVESLKKQVVSHCMCADFQEDKSTYTIIFPAGFYPNGVRCNKDIGKARALRKLINFMEDIWLRDCAY